MMIRTSGPAMQTLAFACWLLLMSANATAAPRGEGGGDALRKAQMLLQKLSTEKVALEKDNLRLADELKKVQSELDATKSSLKSTAQAQVAAQQRNEALTQRVRDDGDRIRTLQDTHRKQIEDARADIRLLRNAVLERDQWITDCQAKNDAMYQTNADLLAAYRDKDAWDALKQSEPVTGLGSVKVENAVQEYRFRLEDLRTVKFEPTAPTTKE